MCECNRLGTDSQVKEFENVLEKYKEPSNKDD